ncbi:MAG: Leucine dehydrogenase [Chlamydiae bacterium]|nr:Leucine dehydrogenase [Chlamydiota bacterium]
MSTLVKKQHIKEIYTKGFEKVLEVIDKDADLHAFVAIHNTRLGPALGGVRMYPYRNREEALYDVLRLASSMTYKFATCGGGFGGGKSVIIGDPAKKTKKQLLAFGQFVSSLEGKYICAEDSGITQEDLSVIREQTPYIVGIMRKGSSGDPSPFTAFGSYRAIQATCKELFGSDNVRGKTIAIQGLGAVGSKLAKILFWEGANLIVSDIHREKAQEIATLTNAKIVDPIDILHVECDILSPCAMGAVINEKTIKLLRCKAICGCANNLLKETVDAKTLKRYGILLAPDFITNSGGAINVYNELNKEGYNPTIARDQVSEIYDRILLLYKMAKNKGKSTQEAAYELAEYNVANNIGKRKEAVVFHH